MQVKKRDGRFEEFDRNKLKNSLTTAGAEEETAESLTSEVETWVPGAAEGGVIESQALWEKVIIVLEAADPETANKYKSYRNQ